MFKFLLFVGVLTTVYFLFFKKSALPNPPSKDPSTDEMVPCAHCGTYVQSKEAIISNGHNYCSSECLKAAS